MPCRNEVVSLATVVGAAEIYQPLFPVSELQTGEGAQDGNKEQWGGAKAAEAIPAATSRPFGCRLARRLTAALKQSS